MRALAWTAAAVGFVTFAAWLERPELTLEDELDALIADLEAL